MQRLIIVQEKNEFLVNQKIQNIIDNYKGFKIIEETNFNSKTIQQLLHFLDLYDYELPQQFQAHDSVQMKFIDSFNDLLQQTKDLYQLSLDYEIQFLSELLQYHYNLLPTYEFPNACPQNYPLYKRRKEYYTQQLYQRRRQQLLDKYLIN